ncbi:TPA: hypothetical protein DIU27_04730 [Candidatus Collierbacteria bacterium]|uniref:Uncharacterized protein n=1 Tax=Candidatus Collierbacteria bacterium GW2011_GWB2_44_22 TaxID=1618387 RepID=A0A0G1KV44_9BACT|nr:MAG: hypothetical protein UW31_C0016G0016 [Candidatus Collierbacteria bacterium GW2011_GWA2_44_13]KKT51769.1 MAG: hypothetical protein UW44_C0008G0091 [Candidatus Collierbacteria bacterium GW2011_GWB2_44_22]KKT65476.1 MAG: hypothetical protein UW58_C0029G0016 [Candidatus Collierbacteria bacterium GW2011_GWC2_44_30]KKT68305.1 MAG: hypothetical protein UW64_C0023G0021 [Microgenomates group bacterium GW2011_GWC1_44_37]KKT87993.1 MAG: hypothetical protein UW88_C0017G0014 [Candidatus Collierbacte
MLIPKRWLVYAAYISNTVWVTTYIIVALTLVGAINLIVVSIAVAIYIGIATWNFFTPHSVEK